MDKRIGYEQAVDNAGIGSVLLNHAWCVAGTPPLGIAVAGSDIDILCTVTDAQAFCTAIWRAYSGFPGFNLRQWASPPHAVIVNFDSDGWPFEIYAAPTPLGDQAGWRHFEIERRLLTLGSDGFRTAVMAARGRGLKTEPAFAAVLGLGGDPYAAMLALFDSRDAELADLLATAGFPAG